MARLTPQQLQDRLKFDFRIAMSMRCPLIVISAFRNINDLDEQRNQIVSEEESHLATHYRIDYSMRTLIGPGRYSDRTTVKIDLLANGNYPYSAPASWVISSQTPWSPHFRESFPICISNDLWESGAGKVLLGDLLIHIAKLLNLDEIPRSEFYGGYNPEAAEYWRNSLRSQPITPQLIYPVLPAGIGFASNGAIENRILAAPEELRTRRPLRVFLCHSSNDKKVVRRLYDRLCGNGLHAWLDEEELLPGQKWEVEIPRAVRNSDVVIVCLSRNAINKSGYVQKEIAVALDVAAEKPEDTIFVIPFKLEPCEIPNRLRHLHCAPFHEEEGYEKLMRSLKISTNRLDESDPLIDRLKLDEIVKLFPTEDYKYRLDPQYEPEDEFGNVHEPVNEEKVAISRLLKTYRNAGLLKTSEPKEQLFWVARRGHTVELTLQGRKYWRLVSFNRI